MRKVTKNKHKCNVVLKEKEKKRHENRHDVCYMTFKYLFTYFTHTYLKILQQLYNKTHQNSLLVLTLFFLK